MLDVPKEVMTRRLAVCFVVMLALTVRELGTVGGREFTHGPYHQFYMEGLYGRHNTTCCKPKTWSCPWERQALVR